jgi:hypothetical protein
VRDKKRIGLWQSEKGWVTDETKYQAVKVFIEDSDLLGVVPCCVNFDAHGSNTNIRKNPTDPGVMLETVAGLLKANKIFGHCPKAHTTGIGTQQLDLPKGIIQKGCANFDALMARQVAASLDMRGKYKGRVSTAQILRLVELAFFEMNADDPACLLRHHLCLPLHSVH